MSNNNAQGINPIVVAAGGAGVGAAGGFLIAVEEQMKHWWKQGKRKKKIAELVKKEEAFELLPNVKSDMSESVQGETQNFESEEDKATISSFLSELINLGALEKDYSGLLRCDIDANNLAESREKVGWLRGFVRSKDGIGGQANFQKVNIPYTAMAFQVASLVVGQYYQHVISERLQNIESKLDLLVDNMYQTDKSTLETIFSQCQAQFKRKEWLQEDYNVVSSNVDKIIEIRNRYKKKIEKIDKIKPNYKIGSNLNEIKCWRESLDKSNFLIFMEIACLAEYTYLFANITAAKMYEKRDTGRCCEYWQNVNINFAQEYSAKYHELKGNVMKNIETLRSDALIHKTECEEIRKRTMNDFERIENMFKNGQQQFSAVYVIDQGEVKGLLKTQQ